jgi:uncharacterized protein YukE
MPFFSEAGQEVELVTDVGANVGATVATDLATVADQATTAPTAPGRLRIEPDQVDGAITVFSNALADVESEVAWAVSDIRATPPAADAVSNDAASAFNRLGYENTDSAVAAWQGAVEQLRSIVDQLEAAKRTIQQADAGNTTNFQVP